MSELRYPLDVMMIRGNSPHNAFGMVRNQGRRAHQGWDLIATPLTNCYAIADGFVLPTNCCDGDYGNNVLLQFEHQGRQLYALYAHLSFSFVMANAIRKHELKSGELIGLTGITGNTKGTPPHLHFEIREKKHVGLGLGGRVDPAQLYGVAPVNGCIFSAHGTKVSTVGVAGLKTKTGF